VATFVLGIVPVWALLAMDHADPAHAASRVAFPHLSDRAELGTGLRTRSWPCAAPSERGRFA